MLDQFTNNAFFWQKVDTIFVSSNHIFTRQKGESHPNYPNLIYPTTYGYLEDTSISENEICFFKGSIDTNSVDAIVVCMDILKKDLECKLLVGCTNEEELQILHYLNQTDFQKSVILRRGSEIPSWAITE